MVFNLEDSRAMQDLRSYFRWALLFYFQHISFAEGPRTVTLGLPSAAKGIYPKDDYYQSQKVQYMCVCNKRVYVDNFTDTVDWLLIFVIFVIYQYGLATF